MFLALVSKTDPRCGEVHFRRSSNYRLLKDNRNAIAALLDAADTPTQLLPWPEEYAHRCNEYAWDAVRPAAQTGPPASVMRLVKKAVELEPYNFMYQNTLGVALYRAGQYQDASRLLEANLSRSGQYVAFDLYFLAMSQHRLGDPDKARATFDRANAAVAAETGLSADDRKELSAFRAEAETVLGLGQTK
jgi:tetratricopeptide (TPR) repeat protein